jgi:hypothetical protein
MGKCDPKAIRAGKPWYKAVRDFKAPVMYDPVLLGAKGRPVKLKNPSPKSKRPSWDDKPQRFSGELERELEALPPSRFKSKLMAWQNLVKEKFDLSGPMNYTALVYRSNLQSALDNPDKEAAIAFLEKSMKEISDLPGKGVKDHMQGNIALYKQSYLAFRRIFGVALINYWDNLNGFNLIDFDHDFLKTPDGVSTAQELHKRYPGDGEKLIKTLIGIKDNPVRTIRGKQTIWCWVRMGDNAEYQKFSNVAEAAGAVRASLGSRPEGIHHFPLGVEIGPGYTGLNYISLFWGDSKAQPIKEEMTKGIPSRYLREAGELTDGEKLTFNQIVSGQRNPTADGTMRPLEKLKAQVFAGQKPGYAYALLLSGQTKGGGAHPVTGASLWAWPLIIVTLGQKGYANTPYFMKGEDQNEAQGAVDRMNVNLGLTKAEADMISWASMFPGYKGPDKNPYGTIDDRRTYGEYIRSRGQRQGEPQTKPAPKPAQRPVKVGVKGEDNPTGDSALFESFHGNPPGSTRTVQVPVPKPPLTKLGRLEKIDYVVESEGNHKNTHFTHSAGDLGERKIPSNTIVASDANGELVLAKEKPGKYPCVTSRGIIG